MKFGDNLKQIRKTKKISQEDLADKLGVSRQSVSKWETGENYPSMQNIMCLCTIFKCSINEIVHEDFEDINSLDEEIKMSVVKFKENEQKKMKGMSKFIYVLARIGKIFATVSIAVIVIASILFTYVVANTNINTKDNSAIVCGEKITYQLDETKLEITDSKGEKEKINVNGVTEKETINKILEMNKATRITLVLFIEVSLVIALFVAFKLATYVEKLFVNIHDNDTPFNMDNVYYIKKIALYTLFYVLSQDLLGSIAEGIYSLDFNIEIELSNYLVSLIILAIAYVFKYGYEIQLDSKGKMYGDINE